MAYSNFEVLVVDNSSGDERARATADRWGARYIVEPVTGLSRARNAGAHACSSAVIAYTDDDAVPDRDWLCSVMAEFRDPSVSIVTGRILSLSEGPAGNPCDLGPDRIMLDRTHPLWVDMACFGGIGNGGNMAFRRCVFDVTSVFDERLGKGVLANGDEHRAFGRLIARGYKAVYTPDAVIRHPTPKTWDEVRAQYLASLSDLTGYAMFLFLRTGFRWKVARYVWQAAAGKKRTWRFPNAGTPAGLVPRWRVLQAYLVGVIRCIWACSRAGQRHGGASDAPSRAMRAQSVPATHPQFRGQ
jgi:glycosyltransferase involved in cell wall biosynthesis